jgi:hypothetical protein
MANKYWGNKSFYTSTNLPIFLEWLSFMDGEIKKHNTINVELHCNMSISYLWAISSQL